MPAPNPSAGGPLTPDQCALILDHLELAEIAARRWPSRWRADALSSAYIGLIDAARLAGPHIRDFRRFANVVISRRIAKDYRRYWTFGYSSLGEAPEPIAAPEPDPDQDQAQIIAALHAARARLTPKQQMLFDDYLSGLGSNAIARKRGVIRAAVQQMRGAMLRRLRAALTA
jgi:RNA polymerase sigma factor (sigma-70 family)